jgi:ATP/maltotriose-dependent transcriptional regulator MalT
LRSLGWIAHQKSETERAYTLYEEALTLYKELNNRRGIANTLLNMAFLTQTRGDFERARVLLEEVVARQRALGNKIGIFGALYQLAQVLFGLYGAADALRIRALLEEGLDVAREVGNRRGVASMHGMLGWLAYSEGNLAGAAQLVEDCLLFFKDGGDRLVTGHYLSLLGQITTARHDYAGAQALFKEGLAIAREIGENKNEIVPNCLEGLAELALLQGYHPWAVRLWGAAGRWREMIDVAVMPSQRVIQESQMESAREFLGAQAFDALLQEGRTLSPEEAFVARSALPQSQRKPQVIPGTQRAQGAQRAGLLPNTGKKKIPAYPAGLSAREVDILRLVAQGLSDIEVAERLVISPRTVTTHLTSIYNKLGVNSRVAATRFAVEHHLV